VKVPPSYPILSPRLSTATGQAIAGRRRDGRCRMRDDDQGIRVERPLFAPRPAGSVARRQPLAEPLGGMLLPPGAEPLDVALEVLEHDSPVAGPDEEVAG